MDTSIQCEPKRSSLPVPDAKFQEVKWDYLGQLIVTPEMVATKWRQWRTINHLELMEFLQNYLMETVKQSVRGLDSLEKPWISFVLIQGHEILEF